MGERIDGWIHFKSNLFSFLFHNIVYAGPLSNMGIGARTPGFIVYKLQRRRSACESARSDQRICNSLFGKYSS